MAAQEFEAQRRTVIGKQVKALRRENRIPGIVYGPVVKETIPVSVDHRQFAKFYQTTGHSTLFTLRWEDGEQAVFIRDVQMHPVRREPIHIDFFAPNLRNPVRALVPLVFHNPNQAAGSVFTETRSELEVEALPAEIPHQIDVDVSGLNQPGDVLRVGDLVFAKGVSAVLDADEIVAQIEAVYVAPETDGAEEAATEVEETGSESEVAES
ncbi:MAG: 50S ribosomal protein L25 [Thermomicrobiales bacterium]